MRNLTHEQDQINLAFNVGTERSYGEIGRLVGACNGLINESGGDSLQAAELLRGVEDVPAAIRHMANLSIALIEYGDHYGTARRAPLRTELERDIVHAVVTSAATGALPVERESVKFLVNRWHSEISANQSEVQQAVHTTAQQRVKHQRALRWLFASEAA